MGKNGNCSSPIKKRKDRDLNPRNSYPFTAFRVRPDRPLRHLSESKTTIFIILYNFATLFFPKNIYRATGILNGLFRYLAYENLYIWAYKKNG